MIMLLKFVAIAQLCSATVHTSNIYDFAVLSIHASRKRPSRKISFFQEIQESTQLLKSLTVAFFLFISVVSN